MGQTMSKVMAVFQERFNKAPPRRATLLDWEKRAFALVSVKDRPRSGKKQHTGTLVCTGLLICTISRSLFSNILYSLVLFVNAVFV